MDREKMKEQDFLKCMSLRKRIKDKIKGRIFISLYRGTLSININSGKGIYYIKNVNNISYRIDYDEMAEEIINDYKRFILDKFFTGGVYYL